MISTNKEILLAHNDAHQQGVDFVVIVVEDCDDPTRTKNRHVYGGSWPEAERFMKNVVSETKNRVVQIDFCFKVYKDLSLAESVEKLRMQEYACKRIRKAIANIDTPSEEVKASIKAYNLKLEKAA